MGTRVVTIQIVDHSIRRVVQAVEPEAARLLIEKGGQITRYELHGMYYWDYQPWEDQCVLSWPTGTISVYVSVKGQEDTFVIFAAFLLPASTQELHMVYDYRPSSSAGPFEEYFTLRAAQEYESVLREERNMARL
ncbi:MAG TPA: hypothetical protein DHW02_18470 [Ktedonobacter sp.]|nr:hypothetical protein [Ktedonobacter sp.]